MNNYICHFCGEELQPDSTEYNGARHWLSDCRPDLVKHEPGPACTWWTASPHLGESRRCYAYQNKDGEWTTEHTYFYTDSPMV